MTISDEERKLLGEVYKRATDFYDQLHTWMKEEGTYPDFPIMPNGYDRDVYAIFQEKFNLAQENVIKKHFSSTHTWGEGVMRWSKKRDNWFMSPLECKVCKMGAGAWHSENRLNLTKVNLEEGDVPTMDMHGNFISRTCAEVLAAKKSRKGGNDGKCGQCNTYDCALKRFGI